jgi:outer membrane immunogenic protein
MNKMIRSLGVCFILIIIGSAAARAQVSSVSSDSWSGPYAGLNAGYGLGKTTIDDQECDVSCSSQTFSPSGGMAGVTVGYNYQIGNTVIGAEADSDAIFGADRTKQTDWPSLHKAAFSSVSTARLRAGLALNNTLLYATGGLAVLGSDASAINLDPNPGNREGFTKKGLTIGLAAGGGLETALTPQLSMKFEYLFIDLPSSSDIHDQYGGYDCATSSDCNFGVTNSMSLVRVGLNYRF